MTPINASADFARYFAAPNESAVPAVRRIAAALVIVPLLAATAWMFWVLANGAMGRQATVLSMVTLAAGAAVLSRQTGWSLTFSLILTVFGGMALLIGALFATAGYALVFGG